MKEIVVDEFHKGTHAEAEDEAGHRALAFLTCRIARFASTHRRRHDSLRCSSVRFKANQSQTRHMERMRCHGRPLAYAFRCAFSSSDGHFASYFRRTQTFSSPNLNLSMSRELSTNRKRL